MSDIEIYLDELKNMESQLGEKAKLFTNEAIKKFVLNCLAKKVSRVDAEVKVNFAELESIQYLNKMRELINLGDGININVRLLILRRKIIDDVELLSKSKISA